MRRFVTLVFLLCLAIPAGINLAGCTRNPAANYCNGLGYGPKITDVARIDLQPQNTGVSLAFGQTRSMTPPNAFTCKNASASVTGYTWGTTNNQLVDISPQGTLCAGRWNRNTGGGIPDFTICNVPSPLPSSSGLPYGAAFVTATAESVVSNPIQVFVHAPVTSVALVSPAQCLSQTESTFLDAEACYAGANNTQYELCAPSSLPSFACKNGLAPGVTSVPSCSQSIGTFSYTAGNGAVATINAETNQITAANPGTTVITSSIAGSSSTAGYFSTCPPASISLTYNGGTSGTVTQGVSQNLVTSILDTKGHTITGLTLDYQSTNPVDVTASSSGSVLANFPGSASIYAVCQPGTCNAAPINKIGVNGNGVPIASNAVDLTVPGTASSFLWFGAPGHSQYVVPVELLTGTVGSTIRLAYVPNSMVMDSLGTTIYFGSSQGLMELTTTSNTVGTPNPNLPGTVLAVSPNGGAILINDQARNLFYIQQTTVGAAPITFNGLGTSAQWTPDNRTLYITDSASAGTGHTNTLYVYNDSTGWSTYSLAGSAGARGPQNLTVTVPGVGAYISGGQTVAHTWCPAGTAGDYASMSFYPQGDAVNAITDMLAATADGMHVLGATAGSGSAGPITLSDIGVTIPAGTAAAQCPTGAGNALLPLTINHTLNQTTLNVQATTVDQVVTAPAAVNQGAGSASSFSLSFVTYNGNAAAATLPYYKQTTAATSSLGTVGYVTLAAPGTGTGPTAPIAGAFSPDATMFFVSTAGDNRIHYISTTSLTDTQQISPNLPACAAGTDQGCTLPAPVAGPVPATVIVVKPRSTT
jgi:hypothetical protein